MFPQPVPQEKFVLCTHGHILTDGYHSVVSKNCYYIPTQEMDEAGLLWQDGMAEEKGRLPGPLPSPT